MLIGIFSDIQHHSYKAYAHHINKARLQVAFDVQSYIYEYCHSRGISTMLFVGDFYDAQNSIPTEVVNTAVDYVLDLENKYPGILTLAISGNHDHASKNLLHKPAVTALQHIERVTNNFLVLDNKCMTIGDTVIYGIPYYEFAEHYQQKLMDISQVAAQRRLEKPNDKYILLIHQTPGGMPDMNIPADTDPNDELYGVFDEIFCGHIHRPVRITPKFTLVGNPNHRDLGDIGNEKGFWVLDTDTGDKEFISLKGKYPEFKYVEVNRGEAIPYDGENFIMPVYEQLLTAFTPEGGKAAVDADNFRADANPVILVTNYWQQTDNVNTDRLAVGLDCLNIALNASHTV